MQKYLISISLYIFCSISSIAQPRISFFNEMKSDGLSGLFKDSTLIPTLQKLHAEIRMGILDLTQQRVKIIKSLNEAKIPVVAWLLLPEEKGYWFHSGNGDMALERYKEIKAWADENQIIFSGIGIDLELDMNDMKLLQSNPMKLLGKLPGRLYDNSEIEIGSQKYAELIATIKNDGYKVESYYASFIKDETALHNTSIQQLTKFLDIKTDKEIPMLYSSFIGNADGLLKIYGMDAGLKQVAIGSTGGGVDTTLPILTYEELVHDLNMASKFADEIHIFSLEGCVQHGYLKKLLEYKSNTSLPFDESQVKSVQKLQKIFKTASSVLSYPTIFFICILLIIILISWLTYWIIKTIVKMFRNI